MKRFFPTVGYVALCCLTTMIANAQEGRVQVLGIGTGEELTPEQRERFAESASMTFATPGGGFSIGSLGGVDPNNRSQLFNLLSNDSVRKELKLTEEQYGGAKQIMKESQQRIMKMIRSRMSGENGNRVQLGGNDFRDLMEENRAQAESAIEEILLPDQLDRLRQIAYQVDISKEGLGESLVNGRLGKEVGVYDDQKQNLLDRAAKIEEEAEAAIIAIRAKARDKLFESLTPEQRKAAQELLGDYFLYKELSFAQQMRRSMRESQKEPASDK